MIDLKDIKIFVKDLNEEMTIKEFLKRLLKTLWIQEEQFSGKRPFGNSGWQFCVYKGLVEAELVDGKIDNDGFLEKLDYKKADEIILKIIEEL